MVLQPLDGVGHTFNDLLNSEYLTMALYDTSNVKQMELVGLPERLMVSPSGYGSLGVSGGDGSLISGTISDVLNVTTSMDVNLNDYCIC